MNAMDAEIVNNLHIVAQMKLRTTRPSLIGEGSQEPINRVIADTTLSGKRQYPNIQAL